MRNYPYTIQFDTIKLDKTTNVLRFKIKYNQTSNDPDRLYNQTYGIYKSDNYYIIPSAHSAFISYFGLLYMLKKLKINRFLIDIKSYDKSIFEDQLVDKDSYKDIMVFENPYVSTNGSKMTLVMINLNKIKLNKIKKQIK